MAYLTLGTAKVSDGTVTIPYRGRAVVDVRVTSEVAKGQSLDLVFENGPTLKLTVVEAGQDNALWRARAVGGSGGLGTRLPAKYYEGIPCATVVKDILTACGETVGIIDFPGVFSRYVRESGLASECLLRVLEGSGYAYRVMFDGSVNVFKTGDFPLSALEAEILDAEPNKGKTTLNILPELEPGVTVDGVGRVGRVVHNVAGRALRTTVYAPEYDLSMKGIARLALPRLDHSALYPASVLKDWGNHTVDLMPDLAAFPAQVRIPLRVGVPGLKVKVKTGARVLLGFENSDPARPYALLTDVSTCELFELATGLGHVLKLDDDRGQTTSDAVYANPTVSLTHKTGASVLIDKDGNVVVTPAPGKFVDLGGLGGALVARIGDAVTVSGTDSRGDTFTATGTITGAASKVRAV